MEDLAVVMDKMEVQEEPDLLLVRPEEMLMVLVVQEEVLSTIPVQMRVTPVVMVETTNPSRIGVRLYQLKLLMVVMVM